MYCTVWKLKPSEKELKIIIIQRCARAAADGCWGGNVTCESVKGELVSAVAQQPMILETTL